MLICLAASNPDVIALFCIQTDGCKKCSSNGKKKKKALRLTIVKVIRLDNLLRIFGYAWTFNLWAQGQETVGISTLFIGLSFHYIILIIHEKYVIFLSWKINKYFIIIVGYLWGNIRRANLIKPCRSIQALMSLISPLRPCAAWKLIHHFAIHKCNTVYESYITVGDTAGNV